MRGVPRWLAVLAVVAIVVMVCAFTLHRALTPAAMLIHASQATLPADGFASTEIHDPFLHRPRSSRTSRRNRRAHTAPSWTPSPSTATPPTVSVRAGVLPGETKIQITAPGFASQQVTLHTTLDVSDSVGDGTPDFLRLHDPADRAAFRRWFTLLAEAQYYRNHSSLGEIDDCAALLRYAYREALRQHDSAWAKVRRAARRALSRRRSPVSISLHTTWSWVVSRARRQLCCG